MLFAEFCFAKVLSSFWIVLFIILPLLFATTVDFDLLSTGRLGGHSLGGRPCSQPCVPRLVNMPDVVAHRISFTRDQLIALRTANLPSQAVRARVRWIFRHRGCRGGAHVKSRLSRSYQISAVEEGCIPTVTVHREPSPTSQHDADARCQRPNLVKLRALRHIAPIAQHLVFGCMNVRSAAGKIDDIVAMKHDRSIDVLCLCETWHDEDSVSIRRLRAEGLQVLERARPRSVSELSSLSTNHGGVAIAASRGVRLAAVNTGSRKSSFEHICARVTSRESSCIVLLIYRPGSRTADANFFTELSDLLDRLATFVDPIMVVGDLNIRLDRPRRRTQSPSA